MFDVSDILYPQAERAMIDAEYRAARQRADRMFNWKTVIVAAVIAFFASIASQMIAELLLRRFFPI